MGLRFRKSVKSEVEKISYFQILLVALSIYVLAALFIEIVVPISASSRTILFYADNIICVVFLFDFGLRFAQAESKLRFLRWGWIDLVSSIPALPILRIGRAVRVVRILKLLRGFRSFKTIGAVLFAHRAKGTIVTAVFLCTLLIVFSSITILQAENGPDATIHGPEDALWWSIVTITTVGYGDKFPITTEGRLIGLTLMICGVGLIAILSGGFAAWFLEESEKDRAHGQITPEEVSVLREEIRALRDEMRRVARL
jgi:voltage-gated potassium channel